MCLSLHYFKIKMNTQVPWIVKLFIRNVVWREKRKDKVIFLTFDDGPIPEVTPNVLNLLDDFGVKATFFCVGENVKKHPEVYQEVLTRGHAVGNHSFNHIKGFEYTTEDYIRNVKEAAKYIDSKLFRPPHGQIKRAQIKRLSADYKIIMWDFITFDYDKDVSVDKIMKIVKKRSRNGSIVVFHDSLKAEKNMIEALPMALKFWKEEGYSLKMIRY